MKGKVADARHWRKTGDKEICRIRREMLEATPESLMGAAEAIRILTESGAICVLGSQRQIDACAGKLNTVEVL